MSNMSDQGEIRQLGTFRAPHMREKMYDMSVRGDIRQMGTYRAPHMFLHVRRPLGPQFSNLTLN